MDFRLHRGIHSQESSLFYFRHGQPISPTMPAMMDRSVMKVRPTLNSNPRHGDPSWLSSSWLTVPRLPRRTDIRLLERGRHVG
jgi:hypothetical protein